MIQTTRIISGLILLASSTQYALGADKPQWHSVDANMSNQEYEDAYRANQRHIRKLLTSYSEGTLVSMGVPKAGINFMGAAAGLAAGQNAKFYLNDSKLFAVELKDATNDDRAVFVGIKVDW